MPDDKIILPDSPEAAIRRTLTGWVSRTGRFWADDERMARWDGATHIPCDQCKTPVKKHGYTLCPACRDQKEIEEYNKLPTEPYEGGWAYSSACEKYFQGEDEIYEYMEEEELTWEDLRMQGVIENKFFEVTEDYWEDIMPDDPYGFQDLPEDICTALEALNKAISEAEPASYSPRKVALLNPDEKK